MSTNILIPKTCMQCGKSFVAKTTVTRYCSHACNSKAYKLKKKEEKIQNSLNKELELKRDSTNSNHSNLSTTHLKEFISIKEACGILGVSRWTIYRMIDDNRLSSAKMGRRTIIRKKDLEKLFQ